jgi:hypothetical protein
MTSASIATSREITAAVLPPDARILHEHLHAVAFQFGVDRGWWRETRWTFPYVDIAVSAAVRAGAPTEYVFRFECTSYPTQAPLAVVWDATLDQRVALPLRPAGRDRVGLVFRKDWKEGQYLYTPFDRVALQDHVDWPAKHPATAWNRAFTITMYLTDLHGLLASSAYTGMAGA